MSPLNTIAFLYPGAMGAGLARVLHTRQPSLRLITHHGARSPDTVRRAAESGLVNVPFSQLVAEADVIISILPPSAAVQLASQVADELKVMKGAVEPKNEQVDVKKEEVEVKKEGEANRQKPITSRTSPLIYIDANAIAPATVTEIATILSPYSIPFIDGCVIGLPPAPNSDPKLYLSSDDKWAAQLKEVAAVLSGGQAEGEGEKGEKKGLDVRVMEGAGEGAASALKMCYGGINKGYVGLATLLVLAANAHSPATADALLKELSLSKPANLFNLSRSIPDSIDKAYRWVGEMEEIGSFISSSLKIPSVPSSNSTLSSGTEPAVTAAGHRTVADTYAGLAQVFQRVADANRAAAIQKAEEEAKANGKEKVDQPLGKGKFDKSTRMGNPDEICALYNWAKKSKERLDEIGYTK